MRPPRAPFVPNGSAPPFSVGEISMELRNPHQYLGLCWAGSFENRGEYLLLLDLLSLFFSDFSDLVGARYFRSWSSQMGCALTHFLSPFYYGSWGQKIKKFEKIVFRTYRGRRSRKSTSFCPKVNTSKVTMRDFFGQYLGLYKSDFRKNLGTRWGALDLFILIFSDFSDIAVKSY